MAAAPSHNPSQPVASLLKAPLRLVYGIYSIAIFLGLGLVALVLVLVVPGIQRRRAVARALSRLFFALAGLRLAVDGLYRLPPCQSVVVSNHACYLDGVFFTAVLPTQKTKENKREMN